MSRRSVLQESVSGALVAAGLVLTCPAGVAWRIHAITVLVTTTATAGNRRITVELLDSGNVTLMVMAHTLQIAASLTASANFGHSTYNAAAAGTSPLQSLAEGVVPIVVLAGQKLRITDQNGVDITDTAKVYVHGEVERP